MFFKGEYMRLFLLFLLLSTSAFAQFTALPPLPPVENAITTKGGLLTSNGTAQVEALACADDEIIVYDSTEANGFKCAAAPSGGGVSYICRTSRLRSNTAAVFDTTLANVSMEIGKTYVVQSAADVSGNNGSTIIPNADLMVGTRILIRMRSRYIGNYTTPAFTATATSVRMRSLGNYTFLGAPVGDDFENTTTFLRVCEVVGGSVSETALN